MTRTTSIDWGKAGLAGTLGVAVKDAAGNILIARTTSGIVDVGGGQYGISIPNWDITWGAMVVIDDGTGTPAGTASEWLDPPAVGIPGTATPLSATVGAVPQASSVGGVVKALKVFQNTQAVFSWRIVDATGAPVDLSSHTTKFFLHDTDSDSTEGSPIAGALSASNAQQPSILDTITITVPPSAIPNVGRFQYKVRDYTTNAVYGSGPFVIDYCPAP